MASFTFGFGLLLLIDPHLSFVSSLCLCSLLPRQIYLHPAVGVPRHPGLIAIALAGYVVLLEQNDEWAAQRSRYMTVETLAPLSDDPLVSLSAVAV
jgi:hypothetical protein